MQNAPWLPMNKLSFIPAQLINAPGFQPFFRSRISEYSFCRTECYSVQTRGSGPPATTAFFVRPAVVAQVKSGAGSQLPSLPPYMPVPCLPVLSQNQRRISTLGLGLDHSLGVAGSSSRQAGAITGPHGPGQASQGCLCRNDARGRSSVMS
uniref:Uncharacterized protein n=1 Tax=Myotis myotis TaxID=51298 RepID=A0A7J7ZWV9_MYOMY|nr:hypothetical protein mMyoMyo1_009700 [Myotis myotis]